MSFDALFDGRRDVIQTDGTLQALLQCRDGYAVVCSGFAHLETRPKSCRDRECSAKVLKV